MDKLKPRKLGHMVLMVRDIHKSVHFYTEIMGLTVSDWISDQMVFLRAGSDHHDLALSQLPKDSPDFNDLPRYSRPGLEHFSYLVDDVEEMERAVKVLQANGIEIVRGIGKHGPGENLFLVFKDPDGNNVELYCEMTQITPDQRLRGQGLGTQHRLLRPVPLRPLRGAAAAGRGGRQERQEDLTFQEETTT
jgi:catechol-2,3-dioxygenase